jgi:hypothetical protein
LFVTRACKVGVVIIFSRGRFAEKGAEDPFVCGLIKKGDIPLVDSTGKSKSGKTERVYRIRSFGTHVRLNSGTGLPFSESLGSTLKWMLLLICLMILCSCGAKIPFVKDNDEPDEKVVLKNPPKSIAVLPFGNKTEVEDLDEFVRETFYSHLAPQPYKDIELREVDRTLKRYNLINYEKFNHVSAKRLGRILRCDAVVIGEVTEFQRVYAGVYSQMAVGASISIWDTRSGKKLWTDEHVTRHHEGGIPLAITDLAMISIRSGLNLRDSEKVKTVDELSRHLISRVPVPDPYTNAKGSKFVSLKRLTKKKIAPTNSTKLRSLKKLTQDNHQQYR